MTTTLNILPAAQASSTRWPWIMLVSCTLLFLSWQAGIALIYLLLGTNSAWTSAAAWWPLTATLTNIVCLILLSKLLQREGRGSQGRADRGVAGRRAELRSAPA